MIEQVRKALDRYWGYRDFLPLQKQAIDCICRGRDSVVVLPTGGGKSICFQAPAVTMPGLAVVVSPLISLMKDQVDALKECGVPAERIDSSLPPEHQAEVFEKIRAKKLKLLYLAPERLVSDTFTGILRGIDVSFVAVDEAHCVSMWGHDFRPEYRQLGMLKDLFPKLTIAAYTATATDHVRTDIAEQLKLDNPQMLIGSFDRPNLIYKVARRDAMLAQICEVLDRHKGESGIVYCLRRKDVDAVHAQLTRRGYRACPYHAGMNDDARRLSQEMFIKEKVDTVVATIAFGMGIDKSNVRYVIHAAMPKSVEHYQQESGRAGRDGLEAECCLFYAAADFATWKSFTRDMTPEAAQIALRKLDAIYNFCTASSCRRETILRYFGQTLHKENCAACDVCLGALEPVDDALVTAQKILSCVLRLDQRFGAAYCASVLTGSTEKRILEKGHNSLSTYDLLSDHPTQLVRDWIEQLVARDYLKKSGDYNVLKVTEKGWTVLKGKFTPVLYKPARQEARTSAIAENAWQGVDRGLFEALRKLRSGIAVARGVPAYVVFSDAVLRDIARLRPSTSVAFLGVKGIGRAKSRRYAKPFLRLVKDYCRANSLKMNVPA